MKLKIDQNKQNVIFSYLFFWEERRKTFRKNSTNCNLYFAKKSIFFYLCPVLQNNSVEAFFRTHKYLVEHVNSPVKRELMREIDWSHRLIGIKGSRGVGKTTFLLQYAKENFGTDRSCLYINLNHLYFTERTLVDFADE